MSLVEELQRDALNRQVPVGDLLRKALVVATKLNLKEFKDWCCLEMEGYRGVEVPDYRKTQGQVVVRTPRRGSTPMIFGDPEMGEIVSLYENRNPLGPLEELANKTGSDSLVVPFEPKMQNLLLAPFPPHMQGVPELVINRGSVATIIEAVRNAILQWSLKLEQDGILGEGTAEEKRKAKADADSLRPNITINIGSMENSVIQHDSAGALASVQKISEVASRLICMNDEHDKANQETQALLKDLAHNDRMLQKTSDDADAIGREMDRKFEEAIKAAPKPPSSK